MGLGVCGVGWGSGGGFHLVSHHLGSLSLPSPRMLHLLMVLQTTGYLAFNCQLHSLV